jgi:hypothetical protein
MEVRPAEMVALEPLVEHDVDARLGGIADQHRVLRAGGARRVPLDLIGALISDRSRIELSGLSRGGERKDRRSQQWPPRICGHCSSSLSFAVLQSIVRSA